MSRKYKIVYVVNNLSPSSIPLEWADILYKRGWNIAVLPVEGQLNRAQPKDFGVPIVKINEYRRGDPRVKWEIRRKIHQHNVRLIHVHQNYSGGIASLAVLANKHVHVVNTEHNPHYGLKKVGLLLNSVTLFRGDYHCFNSNSTMNSLKWWERTLIQNTPKKAIYNGVPIQKIEDESKFQEDTYHKWGLSKDKIYIGKIASFKKQKNHSTLLKAVQLLTKKHSGIRLLLIGDGALCRKLKYQVKKLGITNYVRFMGLLKRKEVYRLLHILNVSVMTSRWEGFCNAIVESMAAGIPVIVSDIPTLKEVVGNSGLHFHKGNPIDLAKKLERLVTCKNLREKYAQLARNRCSRLFDVEETIKEYEEVYRFLLRN